MTPPADVMRFSKASLGVTPVPHMDPCLKFPAVRPYPIDVVHSSDIAGEAAGDR